MSTEPQLFTFELSVQNRDFLSAWRRCNMVANYVADYTAYQFAQRECAENLISTVTNELLEAIVRVADSGGDLRLRCMQVESGLVLETQHMVRLETAAHFHTFLKELEGPDIDDLYVALLIAESPPEIAFNQLGLAMLVHDFGAKVTARLDKAHAQMYTRVFVPNEEFYL